MKELGVFLGTNTNQVAEYEGLIRAFEELHTLGAQRVHVYTDSQFVVRQFTGEYRAKDERMKVLLARAQRAAAAFDGVRLTHIARSSHEGNKRADALANAALDRAHTSARRSEKFTAVAGSPRRKRPRRKVRAPGTQVPLAGRFLTGRRGVAFAPDGKCHRKYTAHVRRQAGRHG